MELKPGAQGVVKPALALRDSVRAVLDRTGEDNVIVPVTEPTDWTRQMVVVARSDGKYAFVWILMNQVLRRENYPMPTLKNIVTTVQSSQHFSTLDAGTGFRQVQLATPSTY